MESIQTLALLDDPLKLSGEARRFGLLPLQVGWTSVVVVRVDGSQRVMTVVDL